MDFILHKKLKKPKLINIPFRNFFIKMNFWKISFSTCEKFLFSKKKEIKEYIN